jgi:dephospho-CoA kinase
MITVALTGNVASGKSRVARIWTEAGVPVLSADQLAREAVKPGSEGLHEVVVAFGPGVLAGDGALDRAALRARVFQDSAARRRLEGILHPRIRELRERWTSLQEMEGRDLVVAEIPLLFETGLDGEFDAIVVVHAPEALRLRRLMEDRNLDEDAARAIMAAQGDSLEKLTRADHVIVNEGTLDDLEDAALRILDDLRRKAAESRGRGFAPGNEKTP